MSQRPRGPRRVPRRERLLGAAGGALGATCRRAPSSPTIGKLIDDAMVAIERDNPSLKGVLPKDYARPALDKQRLGELIDLIGTIGLGDAESRSQGHPRPRLRVLPRPVRQRRGQERRRVLHAALRRPLLVEMLEPYKGRVYDPCCGSGGMFVQSEKFVEAHGGTHRRHLRSTGRSRNPTTWRLAKMNLAIRGIEGDLGAEHADTFHARPAPGPQGRLHPRQSALQHQRLGRRAPARRRALEVRRAAGGQRQLRLGAALHPPPRAARAWPASCWPTARMSSQPVRRGRDPQGTSSRPTWWTA